MDREQTYLFELLKEFDTICRTEKIKYYLADETLISGMNGEISPEPYRGSVIMTAENCIRFIAAAEKSKTAGRGIEYWGNSPGYPDYTARYVGTDSLSYNMFDYRNYRYHGMYIEITILRSKPKGKRFRRMLYNALENGVALNSYRQTSPAENRRNRLSNVIYNVMKILYGGKGRLRKKLFAQNAGSRAKADSEGKGLYGTYRMKIKGMKNPDVSAGYFVPGNTCVINGYEFSIPANAEVFIGKYYGQIDQSGYRKYCIVDGEMDSVQYFRNSGNLDDGFAKAYEAAQKLSRLSQGNRGNAAIARRNWNIVRLTDYRFKMWQYYMPIKDDVIAADSNGDFEKLKELLSPYEEALGEMKKDDMSFSFDNDILKIYLKLLVREERYDMADWVIRKMPKSHYEEIKLEK